MDKKSFYNSKQWVKLALFIRRKYYYVCQNCGKRGTHVHHINPITDENINDTYITLNENNLTLLCLDCHNEIHMGTALIRDDVKFDRNGQLIPKVSHPHWLPKK